ncbi:MAG: glycosyltransferase [Clostridia bacterium]|nr:glycosyltransferase [Clostridia bacterium]
MKILLVNKFLYQKGGSETYVFKLGEVLEKYGHTVEYFGLENEKNIVGNSAGSYVSHIDFNEGILKNLKAPFRIIYSTEARLKLRKVLEKFRPDVIHLNNIQFQLTPSIILEAEKYRKEANPDLRIVYTAHDYQLVCPSHGFFDSNINICEKCLDGNYLHCLKTKCMKNSRAKSLLATADAYCWKYSKAYSYIDKIICPSEFLKSKLDTQERFSDKTVTIHNFFDAEKIENVKKENYILEFGHLSRDKGTLTLLEAAKNFPETKIVFAGYGEAEESIKSVPNAEYVGFKTGKELKELIAKAMLTVCPSEIYENCPFSVIESQIYGTPVIGSRMGGIPELIREGKTGLIFEAGNPFDLTEKIKEIINNSDKFIRNCKSVSFETSDSYYEKLMKIYKG